MIRRHGGALRAALMLVDGLFAVGLSLAVYRAFVHPETALGPFLDTFVARAVVYGIAWVALLYVHGAYRLRAHWTLAGEARTVVHATIWLAVLGTATLWLSATDRPDSGWVLLLFPLQGVLAVILRGLVRSSFMFLRRRGYNVRSLLILGTGHEATDFARIVHDHSVLGVQVAGYLGDEPPAGVPAHRYWGQLSDLPRVLSERVVDEVAICVGEDAWETVEPLAQLAHEQGKVIRVPVTVPRLLSADRALEELDGTAVLSYANGPDELVGHVAKRAFDLGASTAALVLLSPVLLVIAVVLRISQGPGVIFKQTRIGLHGRPFTIYKFRTMITDAEARFSEVEALSDTSGAAFKLVDDPRVTTAGRLMRRYSLDELPQFVNVVRGEMSIVGPRPAPPREVQEYDIWHKRRLSMKPGMTGLWQVSSRLDEDFDQRAELDLAYIDRWSFWLDISIVLRTIPALIRRPGH
jgi:exopolysaccharide biosynthesis polyprenyl glycosylphosphotransferase